MALIATARRTLAVLNFFVFYKTHLGKQEIASNPLYFKERLIAKRFLPAQE
jgi:hypothetical protein